MSEQPKKSGTSIFSLSLRALCVALFGVVGLSLGLVPFIMIIGGAAAAVGEGGSTDRDNKTVVLASREGVKKPLDISKPLILQINIDGVIGMGNLTEKKIQTLLEETHIGDLENSKIKGILLRIQSPGGTVTGVEGVYQAIKRYKERLDIPVVTYIDGISASGGVWLSCLGDQIYSDNSAIIGSIGVIAGGIFNFSQLMEKIGVENLTVSKGTGKDALSSFRPWTEEDKHFLTPYVNYQYDLFVDLVASNRAIERNLIVDTIGARVFPPPQALELGLIDGYGYSRFDAIDELAQRAGLEDQNYQVIELEKTEWLKELFSAKSPLFTGSVKHELALPPQIEALMLGQPLALWIP